MIDPAESRLPSTRFQGDIARPGAIASTGSSGRRLRPSSRWMTHLALILVCLLAIAPFAWMLSTSLKTADNAMRYPPQIWPKPLMLRNYWQVISSEQTSFLLWTRNTVIVSILTVIGTTLSSAVVAYGFAKIAFRGRGALFIIMLATMMIPFPVTMVPLFSIFRWLGDVTGTQWIGTFKPLWVPAWFGSAFSIFLLRQFFLTIPSELSEAARIDGCGEIGIFVRVVLPLAQPALAVVALFFIHGGLERLSGPPGLPAKTRTIHAGPGPAEFPKPIRRNAVAPADGGQHIGHPSRDRPVFPGPAHFHRRDRHDRDQRLNAPCHREGSKTDSGKGNLN